MSGEAGRMATPRLGFGTSGLMSRVNRRQSLRLIELALDEGITHFDTARLYGYGEAEGALGEALERVLGGRRERVTITTKVGILPPRRSPLLTAKRSVARLLVAAAPGLRKGLSARAGTMVQPGIFDLPSVAGSFATSLRALRTGFVDFLLLHECSAAELENAELLDWLRGLQQQGKIRRFGLATFPAVTELAVKQRSELAQVIQLANNVFEPNLAGLTLASVTTLFTHSVLSGRLPELRAFLAADAASAARWSGRFGVDVADPQALVRLALQYALGANPSGTTLFSSTSEAHLRENVRAAGNPMNSEQVGLFQALAEEWNVSRAESTSTR